MGAVVLEGLWLNGGSKMHEEERWIEMDDGFKDRRMGGCGCMRVSEMEELGG